MRFENSNQGGLILSFARSANLFRNALLCNGLCEIMVDMLFGMVGNKKASVVAEAEIGAKEGARVVRCVFLVFGYGFKDGELKIGAFQVLFFVL